MSYLPDDVPAPDFSADEAPFWEHCQHQRLVFQSCIDCGHVQHPPMPLCGRCHSSRLEWKDAPQTGEVFTYTISHHPSHPSIKPVVPFNIIVVAFPQLGDVRLISNLVGGGPVTIGMPVRLCWEEQGGRMIPRFRPAQ